MKSVKSMQDLCTASHSRAVRARREQLLGAMDNTGIVLTHLHIHVLHGFPIPLALYLHVHVVPIALARSLPEEMFSLILGRESLARAAGLSPAAACA